MDILKDALSADRPKGFLTRYPVEIFHEEPPVLESASLHTALARHAPEMELISLVDGKVTLGLKEPGEGMAPEWTVTRSARLIDPESFFTVLEQSWSWPEGASVLPRVRHVLRIRDGSVHGLSHARRIELMQRLVASLLDSSSASTPAVALHWAPTQQLLDPAAAYRSWVEDAYTSPLPGAINVRFYRVDTESGVPGEVDFLMDTLGMCAVGLNDLQCHFRGLDPDGVGPVLYNAALYQWDKGAVLESGHTVQGIRDDDEWLCQHEVSIAPPERDVVDFDPGFPFAAGQTESDGEEPS